jgi:hypothetical protein
MLSTVKAHKVLGKLLRRHRIATLDILFDALDTRSRMTVFRRLKEVGYRSSFTHRGRYYTLEDVPHFDADGLWFYEGVGFSRFGTLKQTVAHMVPEASAGRKHSELATLLQVPVHRPLRDLFVADVIGRQVVEGLDEFVYVSAHQGEAAEQIACRIESLQAIEAVALPPTEIVLAILAEALQASRVGVTPDQLARRLSARGVAVSQEVVERVFGHYELLGGKKNSSPPRTPFSP